MTAHRSEEPLIIVMGPSGAGKSTVGALLAERLDVPFIDGEELHPAENLVKIVDGVSLTGDERRPWLQGVARELRAHEATGVVIACSALRLVYRNMLREAAPQAFFIHLEAPRSLLASRLVMRFPTSSHAALLEDQMQTFEPLRVHEHGARVDAAQKVDRVVRDAHRAVQHRFAPV